MSSTNLSMPLRQGPSQLYILERICDAVHLVLEPDRATPAADVSRALDTLKTVADTMWALVERERLCAETERIKAQKEKVDAPMGW